MDFLKIIYILSFVILFFGCNEENVSLNDDDTVYPSIGNTDTISGGFVRTTMYNGYKVKVHPYRSCMTILMPKQAFVSWHQQGRGTESYKDLKGFTGAFYKSFRDHFDFIIFMEKREGYSGRHIRIASEIEGIGSELWSNRSSFGADSTLKSIISLMAMYGPKNHEIAHLWGNYLFPAVGFKDSAEYDVGAHWGFSSAGGVLGGFDLNTLLELGDNKFKAHIGGREGFSFYDNHVSYSNLELYLMGLVPLSQVDDVIIFSDVMSYKYGVFTSNNSQIIKKEDFEVTFGKRVPDHTKSQKQFRVLFVNLIYEEMAAERWNTWDESIREYTLAGEDSDTVNFNFWEATGGRASLDANIYKEDFIFTNRSQK